MQMRTFAPRLPAASAAVLAASLLLSACGRNDPEKLIASAQDYLNRKDVPAAVIQLKNALQTRPDSRPARFLLGQALLASGDAAGAEAEFRKAQELGQPADEVVPLLANALLTQGEYRKITQQFAKQQLSGAHAQADLKTAVAIAWQRQGQNDAFQASLDEALKAQPDHAPALIELARARAVQGDAQGALALLDKVPAQSPVAHEALKLRGDVALYSKQDVDAALGLYQEALKLRPSFADAQAAIVRLHLALGKTDAAAEALQALVKIAPGHPQTLYLQAQLAYAKQDFKSTQELAQKLLRLAPDHARALEIAGMAELRLNSLVQAQALLAKAVQADPGLPIARRGLVLTYARQGQLDKAVAALPPDLDSENYSDAATLAVAGQVHLLRGDVNHAQGYFAKAARLDPKDPAKRTSLAVSRLMAGQAEAALGELQDIAASDEGVVADTALINALLQRKDVDRALQAIDALEKKRPGDVLPPFLRARALLAKTDPAGARKALERVLEINADYFPAIGLLAQLDNADKRPADARARIEAAIKRQPGNVQAHLALVDLQAANGAGKAELADLLRKAVQAAPGDATARLLLAEHHLRNNELKEALTVTQQAVAAVPDDSRLLDLLGRAQSANGEQQQAQTTFNRLAALQPRSALAQLRLASVHVAAGDKDAARQSFQRALELEPKLLPAQQGLIALAMAQQQPAEALAISRSVQKQRPAEAVGYVLEGDIQAAGKAWDKAADAYRAGLKQAAVPDLAVRLHAALLAGGRKPDADRWEAEWLRTHPKDAAFPFHLGDRALASNDLPKALQQFERVVALQPDNAAALNNLAWVKGRLGRAGALADAERANTLAPNQPALMDTWATLLSDANQHERAVELQKKAVRLQPKALDLKLNLARIQIKAGQKDAARALLDELSAEGDRFPAQAEVERLRKLL